MRRNSNKTVQLTLYDEFDIRVSRFFERVSLARHKNFLFEIIYVLEGRGIHVADHTSLEYIADDIVLSTPMEDHFFEATEETSICTISFNEVFFSTNKSYTKQGIDISELFKNLEVIWYNLCQRQGKISFVKEKNFVRQLVRQLISEKEEKQLFYYAIIQNLISLLLSLIARNLQLKNINEKASESIGHLALDVMNYIQYHIYDKKKLSLSHLAKAFGRSRDSLLYNFKSATGKTIKEFITDYKLSLVKSRLLFSQMSLLEIANELDFTDESHLNKIFKGRMHFAPGKFRELHNK